MKKLFSAILGTLLIIPSFAFATATIPLDRTGTIESLHYTGDSFQVPSLGTAGNPCLTVNGSGTFATQSCGSGGGSSGGSWSTTTSQVAGRLINYPNNNTDIVTVGSNSTTTAKFYFDPNTLRSLIPLASSTAITVSGNLYIGALNGILKATSGSVGTALVGTSDVSFGNMLAYDFPLANNATSTLTQFNGGLTTLASTTIGNGSVTGGLTVSGNSTTTGNALFEGNINTSNFGRITANGALESENNGGVTLYQTSAAAGDNVTITNNGTSGISLITSALGVSNANINFSTLTSGINRDFYFPDTDGSTIGVGVSTTTGNLAYWGQNGALYSVPTTTATCSGSASCTPFTIIGSSPITISASGGSGVYDFPLTGNATSTKVQFNGGLTAFASSTAGNGTQAGGLTIFGGATTTGAAYFANSVTLSMNANDTSSAFFIAQNTHSSGNNSDSGFAAINDLGYTSRLFKTSSFWNPYKTILANDLGFYNDSNAGNISILNDYPSGNVNLTAGGASVAQFMLLPNGNVGIGQSLPSSKLDISDTTGKSQIHASGATDSKGAWITGSDNGFFIGGNNYFDGANWIARSTTASIIANQNGIINFFTNSGLTAGNSFSPTEVMRIDANGNIGVASTTPWAQLSINPNGISGPEFAIGSSTKTDFVVTNAGNVGIGSTSPAYPLSVEGISSLGNQARAGYFTSTSTTVASTFPYASTTALTATTICLTGDTCKTTWPAGTVTSVGLSSPNSTLTIGSTPITTSGTITGDLNLGTSNIWTAARTVFNNYVGMGTSTPAWPLQIASSTSPQLQLTSGLNGVGGWAFRADNSNNFVIGTTTTGTNATSTSLQALQINTSGTPGIAVGTSTSFNNFDNAQYIFVGSSQNSLTKGTCFRAKAVGANSYVYWWFNSSGTQTTQTTSCSGTGTTTVIYE